MSKPIGQLHHIGYLVKDIQSAAELWVQRFGYHIESPVIEDPEQTAFVQFLRLPGDSSWLELVAPNSAESKLTGALLKKEGLHHLCYEVDNMEPTIERLSHDGMLLLAPPVKAVAFPGRRIAWLMGKHGPLIECVEKGDMPLSRSHLCIA